MVVLNSSSGKTSSVCAVVFSAELVCVWVSLDFGASLPELHAVKINIKAAFKVEF